MQQNVPQTHPCQIKHVNMPENCWTMNASWPAAAGGRTNQKIRTLCLKRLMKLQVFSSDSASCFCLNEWTRKRGEFQFEAPRFNATCFLRCWMCDFILKSSFHVLLLQYLIFKVSFRCVCFIGCIISLLNKTYKRAKTWSTSNLNLRRVLEYSVTFLPCVVSVFLQVWQRVDSGSGGSRQRERAKGQSLPGKRRPGGWNLRPAPEPAGEFHQTLEQ